MPSTGRHACERRSPRRHAASRRAAAAARRTWHEAGTRNDMGHLAHAPSEFAGAHKGRRRNHGFRSMTRTFSWSAVSGTPHHVTSRHARKGRMPPPAGLRRRTFRPGGLGERVRGPRFPALTATKYYRPLSPLYARRCGRPGCRPCSAWVVARTAQGRVLRTARGRCGLPGCLRSFSVAARRTPQAVVLRTRARRCGWPGPGLVSWVVAALPQSRCAAHPREALAGLGACPSSP